MLTQALLSMLDIGLAFAGVVSVDARIWGFLAFWLGLNALFALLLVGRGRQ